MIRRSRLVRWGSGLVGLLLATAGMSVASPVASATPYPYCDSPHCYAVAQWTTSGLRGFNGLDGQLRANTLGLSSYTNYFGTEEAWVSPSVDSCGFVEAGIINGKEANTGFSSSVPISFYGTIRPTDCNTYYGHFGSTYYSYGTYEGVSIAYNGSSTWHVYLSDRGNFYTGTAFAAPVQELQTGNETSDDGGPGNSLLYGSSSSLAWWDETGTYQTGWSSGGSGSAILGSAGDYPAEGCWVTSYTWARTGIETTQGCPP
jgi:hypothetical protein